MVDLSGGMGGFERFKSATVYDIGYFPVWDETPKENRERAISKSSRV